MNIKPTNDLLVIREVVADVVKTDWGFELPATADNLETPYMGEVLFAGPGKHAKLSQAGEDVVSSLSKLVELFHAMPNIDWGSRGFSLVHWAAAEDALKRHAETQSRIPMSVKPGDKVVFSKHGRSKYRVNGIDFTVCGEASVMGILEE